MTAQPSFRAPNFGDDDFLPDRRSWYALPLTIMYWSGIFTIVYFATRNVAIEDSVAADGYILTLFITFVLVVFFVIPVLTLFFGRMVDDATVHISVFAAAMRFAAYGLAGGVIPAVFIYYVNTAYGWLPFTQFIIPSALAGAIARLSLEGTLRFAAARFAVIAATTVILGGSLAIGVAVLTGKI
jgi:hypothetical protein